MIKRNSAVLLSFTRSTTTALTTTKLSHILFFCLLVSCFYSQQLFADKFRVVTPESGATTTTQDAGLCRKLLIVADHISAAEETIQREYQKPEQQRPNAITPIHQERMPIQGPKAFEMLLPKNAGYVATPDPNSELSVVAANKNDAGAGTLRTVIHFKGQTTTTFLYYLHPKLHLEPVGTGYLVNPPRPGEKPKMVIWHIHGGGTPNAVAKNAAGKAVDLSKYDVITLANTQHGHGNATNAANLTLDDQIDWNLQAMKQLVHPDVKITVSGHSWGGEFALAMHRQSNLPKYDQIVGFVIESPPIVEGQTLEEKLASEEELTNKIKRLKLGLEPDTEGLLNRCSEKDMKFQVNCLLNGKASPLAAWYTLSTWFDYNMTLMSQDQLKSLKPACFIMGKNDSLCFVGREKAGLEYANSTFGSKNVHILGESFTFEGPTNHTGHQTMDNKLILADGSEVYHVYHLVWEFLKKHALTDLDRDAIINSAYQNKKQQPPQEELLRATHDTLLGTFLLYQNNFAFRSYLNKGYSFLRVRLGGTKAMDYARFGEMKKSIEHAISKYEALLNKHAAEKQEIILVEKIRDMARAAGVTTRIDFLSDKIYGPKKSALAELAVKMSPEREAELRDYSQKVLHMRIQIKSKEATHLFSRLYREKLKELTQKVSKGVRVSEVEIMGRRLFWLGRSEEERKLLSADWGDTNQADGTASKDDSNNLGFSDPGAIDDFRATYKEEQKSRNIVPSREEEIKKASSFEQALQQAWREFNAALDKYRESRIALVPRPHGTDSYQQADWEYLLYRKPAKDHEERRKNLEFFVHYYDQRVSEMRHQIAQAAQAEIDAFQWPDDFQNLPADERLLSARQYVKRIYEIEDDTYVNFPGASLELQEIAHRIKSQNQKIAELNSRIDEENRHLVRQLRRRDQILKQLGEMMQFEEDVQIRENPAILDADAKVVEREFWAVYDAFEHTNKELAELQGQHLLNMRKQNRPSSDVFANIPEVVQKKSAEFEILRDKLKNKKIELHIAILRAANKGHIDPLPDKNGKKPSPHLIQKLMQELVGHDIKLTNNMTVVDPNSLEQHIQSSVERINTYMREKAEALILVQAAQVQYTKLAPESVRYFATYEFDWSQVFDMEWPELMKWFTDKNMGAIRLQAFKEFIIKFESEWKQIRSNEDNYRSHPWYKVDSAGNLTFE